MRKRIACAVVGLVLVLGLAFFYLWSGTANANTQIAYQVTIDQSADGLVDVQMLVHPGRNWFLDLFLREAVVDGISRVSNLQVTRDGRPLPTWRVVPGSSDFLRLWLGGSDAPVSISYQVNPTWMKGSVPRSYLGEDFGYLRGMVTLYTPFTLRDVMAMLQQRDLLGNHAGVASVTFDLPDGWTYLLPWEVSDQIPVAEMRNVYIPVGKLALQQGEHNQAQFAFAQSSSLSASVQASLNGLLPALFQQALDNLQFAPANAADRFVVGVFPADPIHGGAAGISSLICSPEPDTLAHEMFHWWNGHTLQFAADAEWIHEGFTVYYAGKLLQQVGFWSQTEFDDYMLQQQEALSLSVPTVRVNLLQASERLQRGVSSDYAAVYSGGSLIAAWLDRALGLEGSSLDNLWIELRHMDRQLSTSDFLTVLQGTADEEVVRQCMDMINGRQPIPQIAE